MFLHRRFIVFFVLVIVLLVVGCNNTPAPSPTAPPSAAPPTLPPTTRPPADTSTPVPTATNTPLPTATNTPVPPTSSPTPPPTATASPTSKPTQRPASPAPTKPPAAVAPTRAPAAPGVDLVATKGRETCTKKYVSVSYPWEGVQDPQGRKMYYWDERWSVYPMYARPNIRFQTVMSDCGKDNQCKGFTADFCVYVDGSAPNGVVETEVTLLIASALPPDGPNRPIRQPKLLATTVAKFSWLIK